MGGLLHLVQRGGGWAGFDVWCGNIYDDKWLNSIVSYEKSEQVQQANVSKRQTLTFHFSTCQNSFKHLFHYTSVWENRLQRSCIGRRNNTATRSFLINTFLTMSKLFTSSHQAFTQTCIADLVKYLSPLYWTHFRLTSICAKSFCPPKTNDRTLRTGCFQRQRNVYKWCHSDVIVIKLTGDTQNYIPYRTYISEFSYFEN